MYKFFYFKIEIRTKADLYMPCKAMAHSTKYYKFDKLAIYTGVYYIQY
jgi:hypothetical protein